MPYQPVSGIATRIAFLVGENSVTINQARFSCRWKQIVHACPSFTSGTGMDYAPGKLLGDLDMEGTFDNLYNPWNGTPNLKVGQVAALTITLNNNNSTMGVPNAIIDLWDVDPEADGVVTIRAHVTFYGQFNDPGNPGSQVNAYSTVGTTAATGIYNTN